MLDKKNVVGAVVGGIIGLSLAISLNGVFGDVWIVFMNLAMIALLIIYMSDNNAIAGIAIIIAAQIAWNGILNGTPISTVPIFVIPIFIIIGIVAEGYVREIRKSEGGSDYPLPDIADDYVGEKSSQNAQLNMSFAEKIIETIKNPKNAMKSIAEYPQIKEALVIAGVMAVLNTIGAYIYTSRVIIVPVGFRSPLSILQLMSTITTFVIALLGPFLVLLIGTAIVHIISKVLGGMGKFRPQMMTVVGYSMIPEIFKVILWIPLLFIIEPITITDYLTDPNVAIETYQKSTYFLIDITLSTIMAIWASVIFFFGVRNAHRLTPIKSVIVAGILYYILRSILILNF